MDTELKCNRLSCRRSLTDKAVVTTCSHIFCIECANQLFNAARLCPACDTTLTEPDDVVVCSLQPTNDYKTSVLSGLAPSVILEICSRAIAFWQYQIHQENTFQQAIVRNLNDKNGQLQKQLENVVREANGEISLLNSKKDELERDLEVDRRKVRELQEISRDRDKEYAKLKTQFDKLKRRALFGPAPPGNENGNVMPAQRHFDDDQQQNSRQLPGNTGASVNLNAVVGGMEANGIQRTPLVPRTQGRAFIPNQHQMTNEWAQPLARPAQDQPRNGLHRQPFSNFPGDRSFMSANASDRSGSANEVERLLTSHQPARSSVPITSSGWQISNGHRPVQRVFAPTTTNQRTSRGFRPALTR